MRVIAAALFCEEAFAALAVLAAAAGASRCGNRYYKHLFQ